MHPCQLRAFFKVSNCCDPGCMRSTTRCIANQADCRMLSIDLGCGARKQPGFYGVDRYPVPGVDAIVDMDGPLPFRDESVDLMVASHSLEHVNNLLATMKEIYRICKHGSQLCVVAPYSEQKLNQA